MARAEFVRRSYSAPQAADRERRRTSVRRALGTGGMCEDWGLTVLARGASDPHRVVLRLVDDIDLVGRSQEDLGEDRREGRGERAVEQKVSSAEGICVKVREDRRQESESEDQRRSAHARSLLSSRRPPRRFAKAGEGARWMTRSPPGGACEPSLEAKRAAPGEQACMDEQGPSWLRLPRAVVGWLSEPRACCVRPLPLALPPPGAWPRPSPLCTRSFYNI